jgi:dUTP pyrophosphatase
MAIKFKKLRAVKTPNRAHVHDAGIDLFIPEYSSELAKSIVELTEKNNGSVSKIDKDGFVLQPGERVVIPSGIQVDIEDKQTYLKGENKSGIATRLGLVLGACVVDADYHGEIYISLINTSNEPVTFKYGQKIVQLIEQRYYTSPWTEVEDIDTNSDRGTNGFGSTGLV